MVGDGVVVLLRLDYEGRRLHEVSQNYWLANYRDLKAGDGSTLILI